MHSPLRTRTVIAVVGVSGLMLGLMVGSFLHDARARAKPRQQPEHGSLHVGIHDDSAKVAAPRRQQEAKSSPKEPRIQAAPPQSPGRSTARSEELAAQWRSQIAYFERRPEDSSFAAVATPTLQAEYELLAEELGFAVVATECKEQSCRSVIEWPTYADATEHWQRTLLHPLTLNCANLTVLPIPDDVNRPYQATILYDECKLEPHS